MAPPLVWDGGPLGCTGPPPLPGPRTRLPPNYYISRLVEPGIGFQVGRGWTTEQQTPGFFDIQDDPGSPDVVAVQFANIVGAETAAEAAQQIAARENLVIDGPTDVEINGRPAVRLTVESTDPLDTDPPAFHQVLTVAAGPLSIASARRLQINLLDIDGGVLAILVGGSVEKWDRALRVAAPVLESVFILD